MVNCSTAAAEGVGGAEDDLLSVGLKHLRQFGDRGGFSAAVDAGDHDDGRPAFGVANRLGLLGHERLELLFDVLDDFVLVNDACPKRLADLVGDFLGGVDAHVDLDEFLEEIVVKRFIDQPPLRFEEVADVGLQQLCGLLQTLLEFFK